MTPLQRVLDRIDAANAQDPTIEQDGERRVPAALLYGERMSETLGAFVRAPSEALQIAARGQHVERWRLPRADYPEGREGYLAWRREQAERHAARLTGFMAAEGYDAAAQQRVATLLRKQGIKRDPEVQALEDVICLVFLRHYALGFAARHEPEAVARILQKTARKMSPEGRAAVAALDLPPAVAAAFA